MRITTRFLILLIIFVSITIWEKIQATDIAVTGSWVLSIGATDLVAGAGSDLEPNYTSASDAVQIDISNTAGNWQVDVRRTDSNWHSNFILKVKRTSDGTGSGTISGGTTEVTVTQTDQEFFTGSSDRGDVHVELTLENVSVQIPPDSYMTTVYYTVVDI